uniref:Uncharacterized protein n=1 Tax=Arundo donax TaxID=35708 RepID=A0A0A9CGN9_ARUDO
MQIVCHCIFLHIGYHKVGSEKMNGRSLPFYVLPGPFGSVYLLEAFQKIAHQHTFSPHKQIL